MTPPGQVYTGRFAPSPTGPLHFGSLIAAVGSYLDARVRGGRWLVRIEDIDPPRELPGAAADILTTLQRFGFAWDGEVLFQRTRLAAYADQLARLLETGAAYRCRCSRREIAAAGQGGRYPGTCRHAAVDPGEPHAIRVSTEGAVIGFDDRYQGRIDVDLAATSGDFIVRRRDGQFAYQLAVTVDDAAQEISEAVRGVDLIDTAPRQLHLCALLNLPGLAFAHLPIAVDAAGHKLSKQTHARAVDPDAAGLWLERAFAALAHPVDDRLRGAPLTALWAWAHQAWQPERLRGVRHVVVDEAGRRIAAAQQ